MREVQARGFTPGRAERGAPTPQEFEERALGWVLRSGSTFPAIQVRRQRGNERHGRAVHHQGSCWALSRRLCPLSRRGHAVSSSAMASSSVVVLPPTTTPSSATGLQCVAREISMSSSGLPFRLRYFVHTGHLPCTCTTETDKRTLIEEDEEQGVSYHRGYSSSLTA